MEVCGTISGIHYNQEFNRGRMTLTGRFAQVQIVCCFNHRVATIVAVKLRRPVVTYEKHIFVLQDVIA